MRWLIPLLLVALAGCKTDDQGRTVPDWHVIAQELELAGTDFAALSALVDDPALADALQQAAALSQQVAAALEAGAPPGEPLDALEAVLVLAEGLVAQLPADEQGDALVALFVARAVVRRIEAYQ